MAITQDCIAGDPVFSRQERSVVRGIYRAYRLSEAIQTLSSIVIDDTKEKTCESVSACDLKRQELRDFLLESIRKALLNTKVPGNPHAKVDTESNANEP